MSKLIINCETGETSERDLNTEEIKQEELDQANAKKARATKEAEAEAKATARASALAKLEALGLSKNEIATL